jgi:Ferritin-like domain
MTFDRRKFLAQVGLSGAAASAVLGLPEHVFAISRKENDVGLMNIALGLEHQAIYAYGVAGKSGVLSARARDVGLLFQGSHEGHRDLLTEAIKKRGGVPVEPKSTYVFDAPLKTEEDVLTLAFELEVGAAYAYVSVIDKFADRKLMAPASRILSDEVLHATVLRSVLGREVVPSFGLIRN